VIEVEEDSKMGTRVRLMLFTEGPWRTLKLLGREMAPTLGNRVAYWRVCLRWVIAILMGARENSPLFDLLVPELLCINELKQAFEMSTALTVESPRKMIYLI
jgi:hypothetical protein